MFASALSALVPLLTAVSATSGKRGIAGVDNIHTLKDQPTILSGNASTWAYNYGTQPGNATWFGDLEFVPQLWGGNDAASFQSAVLANNPPTRHILTFNEPDGTGGGQATMSPAMAATLWKRYVEPLRQHDIRLGSPACTGTDSGIQWLKEFYGNCTECHVDFIATHWYGSFEGLAAHLGNLYNVFNGTKMWVTELGEPHQSLADTESMFNQTIPWLDGLDWVERYAWFGAFRSSDSNVGTNNTFLDASGGMTRMGREYLFQVADATTASAAAASSSASRTRAATSPTGTAATTTTTSGGGRRVARSGLLLLSSSVLSLPALALSAATLALALAL